MLVEEGEVVGEHSVCYTVGKGQGQSEPGTGVDFEAGQRTVSSDCGRGSPEAEAWENGGGKIQNSGQVRRAKGWGAVLWGSEGLVWVLQACLAAGWSDLAFEADHRHLPPLLADWKAGGGGQESRVCGLGFSGDLEMHIPSVKVCLHLLSHHLYLYLC